MFDPRPPSVVDVGIAADKDVLSCLAEGGIRREISHVLTFVLVFVADEVLKFSDSVVKFNRKGKKQKRYLIIVIIVHFVLACGEGVRVSRDRMDSFETPNHPKGTSRDNRTARIRVLGWGEVDGW